MQTNRSAVKRVVSPFSSSCSSCPSWFILLFCLLACAPLTAADKPRLIVTTDIGGDPDDQQSMIRLMLYSNEFDIEVLMRDGVHAQLADELL